MADISIALRPTEPDGAAQNQDVEWVHTSPACASWIIGRPGTFCIVRLGDDVVASVGYVCHPDAESMQATLSRILGSFDESQIPALKRELIGQYVILVKKGRQLYLFTDFIGGRNLFYSSTGLTISSSFEQAERLEGTGPDDLDPYKVFEFLAMREFMYPAWLGSGTCHRRIKWLLPYEYLVVDTDRIGLRVGSIVYSIDNEKLSDRSALADELLAHLKTAVSRPEFKTSVVAATLTGGHDSRLVAAMAAKEYRNVRFRIAVSSDKPRTMKDLTVVRKVAHAKRVPLDVYEFAAARHQQRFQEITEGMTPCFNETIAPLLEDAGSASLGLGGAFGTELFLPLPSETTAEYLERAVQKAQRSLRADPSFWTAFRGALDAEVEALRRHYKLNTESEQDYVRLLILLDTARYGSFILSAFNRSGYQLDPYGGYDMVRLSLRVAPALWGNHRRLRGMGLVQKKAMAKVDPTMGRVLTYMHRRPMLPLSIGTFPSYAGGYLLQGSEWVKSKLGGRRELRCCTALPGGSYSSDGWERHFIARLERRYGLSAKLQLNGRSS